MTDHVQPHNGSKYAHSQAVANSPGAVSATMGPRSDDGAAKDPPATGRMEIVLSGDRRVIVDQAVDGPALSRVIAVLERR